MATEILSAESWWERQQTLPGTKGYLAMYSSLWDGIVTDPGCMQVPVDDHLVHRGDGVFETLLCEEGALYNLGAHIDRLWASAAFIGLTPPMSKDSLTSVVGDVFRVAGKRRALGRLLLGRGPGGFSVDPAESETASLYLVVYPAPPAFMDRFPEGARVITSTMPPKPAGLSRVKTCNYLPNALMKAEASAAGVHFAIGVDADGFLTESFTENMAAVDQKGRLIIPPAVAHLAGTTLARVVELAADLGIASLEKPIRPSELFDMQEVWLCGTTAYVTSVVELDGKALSTGPLAARLGTSLREDIRDNAAMRTAID